MNQVALHRRPAKFRRKSRTSRSCPLFAPPLRLTPALCGVLAACVCLSLSAKLPSARAGETFSAPAVTASSSVELQLAEATEGALLNLRIGRAITIALPAEARYAITGSAASVQATQVGESLIVTALAAGRVVLMVELPTNGFAGKSAATLQKYTLRIAADPPEISNATVVEPSTPDQTLAELGVQAMSIPPRAAAWTLSEAPNPIGEVASSSLSTTTMRAFVSTPRATSPATPTPLAARPEDPGPRR